MSVPSSMNAAFRGVSSPCSRMSPVESSNDSLARGTVQFTASASSTPCASCIFSIDDINAARERIVPAGSTRARLLALHKAGCDIAEIATMLDVTMSYAANLMSGEEQMCTEMTRLRSRAACEARGLLSTAESMASM